MSVPLRMDLQPSSFAEFERAAQRGNVVPVVRTVAAESRTPSSALSKITGAARYSFLLESVEGNQQFAQYSFLGAEPQMVVRGRGNTTIVERGSELETLEICVPDFLRDYFRKHKLARRPGLPPFAGGMVGYLAYSAAKWFEPALPHAEESSVDDALLMFYRTVLAFDRINHQVQISCIVFTDEAKGSSLQALYEEAVDETARIEAMLNEANPPVLHDVLGANVSESAFSSNWTRDGFQDAVRRVKEYIAAGDCYQAVLSQRFTKRIVAAPASIYEALRVINPSPYMFFLRMSDTTLIGASPEMLVRCRGPRLDYRPIAGTRRRGANKAEDWLLASEMRRDEKEVAEHMMLVDLGRNDLGRVADYGSVQLDDLMNVESYSHVLHLVSSLRARLRNGLNRFDALASCFPAGTVTGAPKVRAMQIINDLEPTPRGIYAGTVLHADYGGSLDSCISIRTIVLEGTTATVQAGAGIVADSVPEQEYEETINKAKGLMRAIEIAEKEFRRQ